MPGTDRLPYAALGFGLAAALSSWNPLSAPFGVVVGLVALLLAVRALVLALTAGVGRELAGTPVVPIPARERARSELDALGGAKGGAAGGSAGGQAPPPAPAR